MARGGYRPGAGRPKKSEPTSHADIEHEAEQEGLTPLAYMLEVMNDAKADKPRRDRMAIAAAPFVHARAEAAEPGKKEKRQDRAEAASSAGKFAAPSAPKLVVSNR